MTMNIDEMAMVVQGFFFGVVKHRGDDGLRRLDATGIDSSSLANFADELGMSWIADVFRRGPRFSIEWASSRNVMWLLFGDNETREVLFPNKDELARVQQAHNDLQEIEEEIQED